MMLKINNFNDVLFYFKVQKLKYEPFYQRPIRVHVCNKIVDPNKKYLSENG